MRISFENYDANSSSGPNSFGQKLERSLKEMGHEAGVDVSFPDVQLTFISSLRKYAPQIQRLDGIYFNTRQDWRSLNNPIRTTFEGTDAVVYQSEFNKILVSHYFGSHAREYVINNGTCLDLIAKIPALDNDTIDSFENVWSCASSWRPHKRLDENIRYFLEHASDRDCLIIAGHVAEPRFHHERVFFAGDLVWNQLISLYKRSANFLHLAAYDHCPNVVVDARACGCHVICSDTGGTQEIAGLNSTIIAEDPWDYRPFDLYSPRKMDFSRKSPGKIDKSIDINDVTANYLRVFRDVIS